MAAEDRVKRRLLEGLVEDNLEAVEGRPRGSLRRARTARAARLRRLGATLVALAVVVTTAFAVASLRETSAAPASPVAAGPPPPGDPPGFVTRLASALAAGSAAPPAGAVIPLEVGTVVVDPGHGGVDSGTSSGFGLIEKDLTLDIARRVAGLLEARGCRALLTRDDDRGVSLRDRALFANSARADLFVSIHANWLPDRRARGFETYSLGPAADPLAERLAAAENTDSGFAVADYRELLERLWSDVRQTESRRLAEAIQVSLVDAVGYGERETVDRGVMTAPFVVLVATEMPAALVEVACLSNDRDAGLLGQPLHRQRLSEAIVDGLAAYAASIAGTHAKGAHG